MDCTSPCGKSAPDIIIFNSALLFGDGGSRVVISHDAPIFDHFYSTVKLPRQGEMTIQRGCSAGLPTSATGEPCSLGVGSANLTRTSAF